MGGYSNNGPIASSEIINVDTHFLCNVSSYPFNVVQHASSTTPVGVVTCGGYDGIFGYGGYFNTCKQLLNLGAWVDFPAMNSKRHNFGLMSLDGFIWAVGSGNNLDYNPTGNSIEYIDLNNPTKWSQQTMAFSVWGHCLAELSRNKLIVTAGWIRGVSK